MHTFLWVIVGIIVSAFGRKPTLAVVLAMAWAINRFAERPFASRMRRSVEHTLRATPPAVAGSGSGSARS